MTASGDTTGCSPFERVVKYAAAAYPCGEPALAAKSVRLLDVVPRRDVGVAQRHVLAQHGLVQITRVVEHEDNLAQPVTAATPGYRLRSSRRNQPHPDAQTSF